MIRKRLVVTICDSTEGAFRIAPGTKQVIIWFTPAKRVLVSEKLKKIIFEQQKNDKKEIVHYQYWTHLNDSETAHSGDAGAGIFEGLEI